MKTRHSRLLSILCALGLASPGIECCGAASTKKQLPNIVLILADDAGYADFGFQGSTKFRTPHLDRLASQSVRATQAYVTASVCGPSRAGLLTGRHQARFGFWANNIPDAALVTPGQDQEDLGLPLGEKTIADRLKPLGYTSALVGKWHQGEADRFHPLNRGFDFFHGLRTGMRSYWAYLHPDTEGPKRLENGMGNYAEHQGYLTDHLADVAAGYIERNRERPFFLFLSFTAVHDPMEARSEDLREFPELSGPRKTLAAMTLAMDRAIGRVVAAIDAANLQSDTIVVFTNDNGGPSDVNASSNDPLSGVKATPLEGGLRVPFLVRWPGVVEGGGEYRQPISTLDLLPTFIAAAGGQPPEGIDGVDLAPFFSGAVSGRPHRDLYWIYSYGRAAIREDDWKLIRLEDRPAELYDLAADPSETVDLAARFPELTRRLFKKLFEFDQSCAAPLWNGNPKWRGNSMRQYDKYKKPLSPIAP